MNQLNSARFDDNLRDMVGTLSGGSQVAEDFNSIAVYLNRPKYPEAPAEVRSTQLQVD